MWNNPTQPAILILILIQQGRQVKMAGKKEAKKAEKREGKKAAGKKEGRKVESRDIWSSVSLTVSVLSTLISTR